MRAVRFLVTGFAPLLLLAAGASADTVFLRVGTTLKVESLTCSEGTCVASVRGGEIEVRASDILKVEADEVVDFEVPSSAVLTARPAGVKGSGSDIEAMVLQAARRYALPPSLVRSVARAESGLDPEAVSSRGAQGVMQLMPGTAKDLGVRNAFDPEENIDAGARLLRQLLEKYDGRVAESLAAYHAGSGAVARHQGVPPYRETRAYIRRVVKGFETAPPEMK